MWAYMVNMIHENTSGTKTPQMTTQNNFLYPLLLNKN